MKKKIINLLFLVSLTLISFLIFLIFFPASPPSTEAYSDESIKLPILMYHGLTKNKKYQNKFMISPDVFENDIEYISKNGFTPININDLVNYVYGDFIMPEKPIIVTFDDGYYNNYLYAFPIAKKYNFKIVISPIGKFTDYYSQIQNENEEYSNLNWNHIREMVNSGLVEIQNHTYDLHSMKRQRIGCTRKKGESIEQYKEKLKNDLEKMQNRIFEETNTKPCAFVYPFGAISKETPQILKELGFKCTLCCESKLNSITKDPECLYGLGRFIRTGHMSSELYFSKILKKYQN